MRRLQEFKQARSREWRTDHDGDRGNSSGASKIVVDRLLGRDGLTSGRDWKAPDFLEIGIGHVVRGQVNTPNFPSPPSIDAYCGLARCLLLP